MKYAFLADIHGNLDALQSVIRAVEDDGGIDRVCCVGDLVGYGAQPGECVALVRDLGWPVVAGNHDYAAIGNVDLSYFNPLAREAIEWTSGALAEEDKEFLGGLPLTWEEDSLVMVHGTLYEPESFGYILSELDARMMFRLLDKDFCFTGHSHYPCVFVEGKDIVFSREPEVKVETSERALVNVGGVGQPRDGDPRACWVAYDEDARTVAIHRVEYDIKEAARRIIDVGLPEPLAERLFMGT